MSAPAPSTPTSSAPTSSAPTSTAPAAGRAATPRRIAVVVTSLHGGGAEAVGRAWMGWLAGRGHHVLAVTTSSKPTDEHLPAGVRLAGVGDVQGHRQRTAALRELLLADGVDVVIALQAYPNLLALAAASRVRGERRWATVISERNLVSLGLAGASPRHRATVALAKRLYRRADRVVAISHPVAAELVAAFGVRGDRCLVVPNPAAEKASTGTPPARPTPPGPPGEIEVVLVHRLVVQKRPLLAVAAVAALERRGVPARLTVFGDGPLREDLLAAAARAGVRVDARGWVEHWHLHCSDRAVQLLASSREGFGNVLVEAAAVGVPSVAVSGALGVADAVVPGLTGVLALDDSPESLADAVAAAADLTVDPVAIAPWLERFSLRTSGQLLEQVLDGVLSGTTNGAAGGRR